VITLERLVACLAAVALLAACGSAPSEAPDPVPPPVDTVSAPVEMPESTGPELTGEPTPPVSASDSPPPTAAPESSAAGTVPDVVGLPLPDAKDKLKFQGYPKVSEVDATGQGRRVLKPDNWVVRSQVPPGGTRLAPGTVVTLRIGKPTDGQGSDRVTPGVMPDVVCKDLHDAKDLLKQAGFDQVKSQDATGKGRIQVLTRNWVVVTQSIKAGTRPGAAAAIMLSVVKVDEPTGATDCGS